jgi:hypothetical protein
VVQSFALKASLPAAFKRSASLPGLELTCTHAHTHTHACCLLHACPCGAV